MDVKLDFENKSYKKNKEKLELVNDVFTGISKLKEEGRKYLYQFENESDKNYLNRLKRATFNNVFKHTILKINSLLYRKDIKIDYKNKDKRIIEDFDNKKTHLKEFAEQVTLNSLKDGVTFIWADAEKVENKINKINAENLKVFAKNIKRENLINYKIKNNKLSLVVLKHKHIEEKNEFEEEERDALIILRINKGELYIKNEKGKYELKDTWKNNLGYIPFFPVYSLKTDFMDADIPFFDLAVLNLEHYNISSDVKNIISLTCYPIFAVYSESDEFKETLKSKKEFSIAAPSAVSFVNKQTDGIEIIEASGSSIKTVKEHIKEIEENMEKIALTAITNKSFNTATEAKIADGNSKLFLNSLANSLENALINTVLTFEKYLDRKIDFIFEINKDFNSLKMEPAEVDKLIKMKNDGLISIDTLWYTLEKGEILKIEDKELEKQKIEDEIGDI